MVGWTVFVQKKKKSSILFDLFFGTRPFKNRPGVGVGQLHSLSALSFSLLRSWKIFFFFFLWSFVLLFSPKRRWRADDAIPLADTHLQGPLFLRPTPPCALNSASASIPSVAPGTRHRPDLKSRSSFLFSVDFLFNFLFLTTDTHPVRSGKRLRYFRLRIENRSFSNILK